MFGDLWRTDTNYERINFRTNFLIYTANLFSATGKSLLNLTAYIFTNLFLLIPISLTTSIK